MQMGVGLGVLPVAPAGPDSAPEPCGALADELARFLIVEPWAYIVYGTFFGIWYIM